MKTYLSYSLIFAAAASGMAFGAVTAYTTPVGYTSLTVPASTDTNISLPLQRAAVYAVASSAITGNQVSVSTSAFTVNQFGASVNMLQVTSGLLIGRTFPILSNTTTGITVDPVGASTLQAQGFAVGDKFAVRPFWTLNTLFPAGTGIGISSDPFSPTSLLLINNNSVVGLNRGAIVQYFYYDGSAGGAAGWYNGGDLGAGLQNDVTLPPSVVITARNFSNTSRSLVISGEVPSVPVATFVISSTQPNDSLAQLPYPIDTSLDQSRLFESTAVSNSSDPFSPTDVVLVFNPLATGLNPGASAQYFRYDGSQGGSAGWYNAGDLGGGVIGANLVLKAGSFIIVRKASGAVFQANTWTAPLPYTL